MSYGWLFLNSGYTIISICEECVFTKCRISEQTLKIRRICSPLPISIVNRMPADRFAIESRTRNRRNHIYNA